MIYHNYFSSFLINAKDWQKLDLDGLLNLSFWTPGLPEGVLSNHPCLSVCVSVRPCVRPSVFKYLRDRSLVFSETLHEVRRQ